MGNQTDKSFTWVIKNFSYLQSEHTFSKPFMISGCKWCLVAYPKGDKGNNKCLSLYLHVLPSRWRRHTKFSLTVVNQLYERLSQMQETREWFDKKTRTFGFSTMLPLSKLHAQYGGFLVNGDLKIVVEIDVIEIVGKLDVSEESKEATNSLKKINDDPAVPVSTDLVIKTQQLNETVDVKGFLVHASQVKYVKLIFERYPDIASEVRSKKRCLRETYMNVLLGLIETLCQLPEDLSDDDLDEASVAVSYMANGGFKVGWLENKLEEIKEKKKKVDKSKVWLQQLEEELHNLNVKCLDLKDLLEKGKVALSAINVPLSFDDIV